MQKTLFDICNEYFRIMLFFDNQVLRVAVLHDATLAIDSGGTIEADYFTNGASSMNVQVCFAAGYEIELADGTTKRIEDFEGGEEVWARAHNKPNGSLQKCKVVRGFKNGIKETMLVRFGNGLELRGTKEHPFYVQGKGWLPLGELAVDDVCYDKEQEPVVVKELICDGQAVEVYNVEVEGAHTYYIGKNGQNVLSHNTCQSCRTNLDHEKNCDCPCHRSSTIPKPSISTYQFGHPHIGGSSVGFDDGSGRFLHQNISPEVLARLQKGAIPQDVNQNTEAIKPYYTDGMASPQLSPPKTEMTISPAEAYWGWLDGTHLGNKYYPDGSRMTDALKQHPQFDIIRQRILDELKPNPEFSLEKRSGKYPDLVAGKDTENKWVEAGQVFRARNLKEFAIFCLARLPWSTDATQIRGNIGSFTYTWKVTDVNPENKTVTVTFRAFNRAGYESFLYGKGKDKWGATLDQTFEWTEVLHYD